ncbi:hypothetical protein GCM10027020_02780 [Nocardioides salsibiostraticola]
MPSSQTHHPEVVPIRMSIPLASTQGTLALDLQPRLDPPSAPVVHLRSESGDLDAWTRRFAQAVVEIVGGDRPASQLLRWTDRDVYLDLRRRAVLVARAGAHTPAAARVQSPCPRVESVHSTHISEEIIETCIRIRYGQRSRAIAARFEHRNHGLVCTALEFA